MFSMDYRIIQDFLRGYLYLAQGPDNLAKATYTHARLRYHELVSS